MFILVLFIHTPYIVSTFMGFWFDILIIQDVKFEKDLLIKTIHALGY